MFQWTFFGFFHPSIYVFYRKTTIGKHLILFWSLIYVWTYNLYAFTLVNSRRHVLMDFFGFFYQSIYVFDHIITIGKHIILFWSLIYLFLSFSYPINQLNIKFFYPSIYVFDHITSIGKLMKTCFNGLFFILPSFNLCFRPLNYHW